MDPEDIADIPEPWIEDTHIFLRHCRLDPSAVVVPADDDMFHLEVIDGIVDDTHHIDIYTDDQVADVAVHKDFSWLGTHHLFCRDPAVTASDIEIVRVLIYGQLLKKFSVRCFLLCDPFGIVFKYLFVRDHLW